MNILQLAGHLGQDPRENTTTSGKKVINLNLAVAVNKDETMWWDLSIWDGRFNNLLPYLKKGSPIIVVGSMSIPQIYTAKDASQKIRLKLNVDMLKFSPFGKKNDDSKPQQADPFVPSGNFLAEKTEFGNLPF